MKILYLSQYFPPELGAASSRVSDLAREWTTLGHEVTVLTGFPNYPTGIVPQEYRGQLVRRDDLNGVRVVRTPIYAAPNRGLFRRALYYTSYGMSASVVGPFITERPDVIIATSPPFLTALAGLALSAVKRVPFVFEVRDLWPRSIVELGAMKASNPVIRVMEKLERMLYRRADLIVPVTHSFVDAIAAHGIPESKMTVVTNGVDLNVFRPSDKDEARASLGLPPGFLATYVGTHGMAHGLDIVLDTAKRLAGQGVKFLLVGEGAEKAKLKARVEAERIENVTLWDQQPRERVAQIYAASDICLVLLRNLPLFKTVIPSKMFEFMGSGRPIVTTVDGESREILERAGAGVFSTPGDAEALASTLSSLATDPDRLDTMGRAGRFYVEANYSRHALAVKYLDALSTLVPAAVPEPQLGLPPA